MKYSSWWAKLAEGLNKHRNFLALAEGLNKHRNVFKMSNIRSTLELGFAWFCPSYVNNKVKANQKQLTLEMHLSAKHPRQDMHKKLLNEDML